MEKIETTLDVTNALMQRWDMSEYTALAERLGVDKQSIGRYKQRKTVDLQTTIIIALLNELEQCKQS